MRFWLEMGVDALGVDAIPYLLEREGTSCENLPETHAIIRKLRREIDSDYSDRMFLDEANHRLQLAFPAIQTVASNRSYLQRPPSNCESVLMWTDLGSLIV